MNSSRNDTTSGRQEYDEGMESDFGYVIPRMAAETFQQFVPKESRVLDAGAGTGLVGVELHRLGYTNLDAMDMSQGMLDEARGKGVYGNLYQMVMGEPLDLETGSYDAAICVGVLTLGHAPVHSLDELARIVRPGGLRGLHPASRRLQTERLSREAAAA